MFLSFPSGNRLRSGSQPAISFPMSKPSLNWTSVPIPDRMRDLPRDRRGYPIPVNVLVDKEGQPHFTINDHIVRRRLLKEQLCGICGKKLLRGRWSVGGPASALVADGVYFDPPLHYECASYALQVCPYLAMPSYSKRIDTRTLDPRKLNGHLAAFIDPTQLDNRPPVFVAVMHVGETYSYDERGEVKYIKPKRPHRRYEFWKDGVQLSEDEGMSIANEYLEKLKQENPQMFRPSIVENSVGV